MTHVKVLNENMIPQAFISAEAMARIREYVSQSPKEIGGMGQVQPTLHSNGMISLMLYNPYVPRQEVSGATTDLDPDGPGSFAEWAMKLEHPELVKWWWHSHVNMGTTPSGTDIKTFYEHIENDPDGRFVMTVHNKDHDDYCNIYLGAGMYAEEVPLTVHYPAMEGMKEDVAAELKANVREKIYAAGYQHSGAGFNAPNVHHSREIVSAGTGKRAGRGSGGQQLSDTALEERNVERNSMGLRLDRVA